MAQRRRLEDVIQRNVMLHLRSRPAPGVCAMHVPNGGWRSPIEGAIFKGLGVMAGAPDVLLLKHGRAEFLELKAPGGRVSDAQKAAHERLRAAGCNVAICYGLDEAIGYLEEHGYLRGALA